MKKDEKTRKRRPRKRDEALLTYLKENPGAPLQQAADAFFISAATVWRFVQDMRNEGKLQPLSPAAHEKHPWSV